MGQIDCPTAWKWCPAHFLSWPQDHFRVFEGPVPGLHIKLNLRHIVRVVEGGGVRSRDAGHRVRRDVSARRGAVAGPVRKDVKVPLKAQGG